MKSSFLLAQIIGPIYLVVAVGLFLGKKHFKAVYQEFMKSPALLYLGGLIALIIGLLIVSLHNVWGLKWNLFITLVGWLGILKGVTLIAFPKWTISFWKSWKMEKLLNVALGTSLVLGVVLTYFGYFA